MHVRTRPIAPLALAAMVAGCAPPAPTKQSGVGEPTGRIDRGKHDWTTRFDFDGDGRPDVVEVAFSGGAHCCYSLAVRLTKSGVVRIPFELDGGYVGGLSLEQPGRFAVDVGPDGVATFSMRVATYDGRPDPIPAEWARRYGVLSHSVRVDVRSGALRVENQAEP